MAASTKRIWRKLGFTTGIALLVLLGIAQLFKRDLHRLHFVLNLFQPATIAENFRSIPQAFANRKMRRSGPTYRIPYQSKPLPETYGYAGRDHALTEWITKTATSGFIVVHKGKIAYERYRLGNSAKTHWVSWSASTPFVAAVVGVAMEEGLIRSLADLASDYDPRLKFSEYSGVVLQDLLQRTSGIAFGENYGDFMSDINRLQRSLAMGIATMDGFILSQDRTRAQAALHNTSGMDAQVVAMVLRSATGRSLTTYMEEKLWSRLGAEDDAFWLVDGNGTELVFWGLIATLRDLARFGMLYLNNGRNFRGQQIIPAHWIRDSVRPGAAGTAPSPPRRSGYQWWLPSSPEEGDYWATGICGQFIYVHPRHRVVIAKTSAYADDPQTGIDMEAESLAAFRAIAAQMGRHP